MSFFVSGFGLGVRHGLGVRGWQLRGNELRFRGLFNWVGRESAPRERLANLE